MPSLALHPLPETKQSNAPFGTYSPALGGTIKTLIVVVVTLVTCMEFLTSYAVGVALPDIQGDLAASFDEGSWVLTTYTTCFLIGLVLSNWLVRPNWLPPIHDRLAGRGIHAVVCRLRAKPHISNDAPIPPCAMGFAGGNFLVRAGDRHQSHVYRQGSPPCSSYHSHCASSWARECAGPGRRRLSH